MHIIRRGGQSVTEYAIVFSVVAAAILGMQIFLKRGLQAKEKDVVDHFTSIGGTGPGGGTIATVSQYEPYYAKSDYTVTQGSTVKDEVASGGKGTRTVSREDTTRTGATTTEVGLGADDSWK